MLSLKSNALMEFPKMKVSFLLNAIFSNIDLGKSLKMIF